MTIGERAGACGRRDRARGSRGLGRESRGRVGRRLVAPRSPASVRHVRLDELRLDLGPRVSSEIGKGTRGKSARVRTVRPGRRGLSERARRRHRRWMRRSAVTAATRGVRLTVRQGTERARLSIIVRRLEKNDRRAKQNIWHFVDSGRRSFSHSSMRCVVLYNTSTRSHASPPTTQPRPSRAHSCVPATAASRVWCASSPSAPVVSSRRRSNYFPALRRPRSPSA